MKYLVEKGLQIPLCAVKENKYINVLTKSEIFNKNTLNFIENGLENKKIEIKEMSFNIYEIGYFKNKNIFVTVAYKYMINGLSNYLDTDKQILRDNDRQFIFKKIISGDYIERLIWDDINE